MQLLLILPGYFLWHYTIAFRNIFHVWMNLLWFINRVFSIPLLLRTLLSPWKRIVEDEATGFDLERWAENVVVNFMSRVVGALVRIPIIFLGLLSLLGTLLFGVLFYVFWICAPVVIGGLFIAGLVYLV